MYDTNDFFQRLTKLRLNKDVSQREMSLDLGQGASYVKQIEKQANFPSLTVFFNICDYFGIHPREFFGEDDYPKEMADILQYLRKMDKEQLACIKRVVRDMTE